MDAVTLLCQRHVGLQVVVPAATAQRHQELRELLAGYPTLAQRVTLLEGQAREAMVKRLVKTQWISLPNLIAQESVVPELIQHAATPEAIAEQSRPGGALCRNACNAAA